jgi:hypothetical protein
METNAMLDTGVKINKTKRRPKITFIGMILITLIPV